MASDRMKACPRNTGQELLPRSEARGGVTDDPLVLTPRKIRMGGAGEERVLGGRVGQTRRLTA